MNFNSETCRRLHAEHAATFVLLDRFGADLRAGTLAGAPLPGGPEWNRLARAVADAIEGEVARHFAFEERAVLPFIEEQGSEELAGMLREEHVAILAVAQPLARVLRGRAAERVEPSDWPALRSLGLDLCDQLAAHARREDQALLPELDAYLDAGRDRELIAQA